MRTATGRTRWGRRSLLPLLAVLALLALAAPASAHETRKVGRFYINDFGLTGEPVVAGEQTEFEFVLSEGKPIDEGGEPVNLKPNEVKLLALHLFVGVVKATPELAAKQPGGKPMALPIRSTPFIEPGMYRSDPVIFPLPGAQTAHLHTPLKGVAGEAKTVPLRGQVIDLQYPMGEGKYGPVEDPKAIMFPANVKAPTTAELAVRMDREAARVAALHNDEVHGSAAALDAATTATWLAAGGLGLGLVALLVALRRRRGRTQTPAEEPQARVWTG